MESPGARTASASACRPWSQKVFISIQPWGFCPSQEPADLATPSRPALLSPLLQGTLVDPRPFSLLRSRKEIAKSCSRTHKTILFVATQCSRVVSYLSSLQNVSHTFQGRLQPLHLQPLGCLRHRRRADGSNWLHGYKIRRN